MEQTECVKNFFHENFGYLEAWPTGYGKTTVVNTLAPFAMVVLDVATYKFSSRDNRVTQCHEGSEQSLMIAFFSGVHCLSIALNVYSSGQFELA